MSNNGSHDSGSRFTAVLLIALGAFFLAANLGWLGWFAGWAWSLLFLLAGAGFLYHYRTNRGQWWALIPGFALLALGLTTLGGNIFGGGLFLALIGVGFIVVYGSNRDQWWAIIPGGVLVTLGSIVLLEERVPAIETDWLLFLGIALTFGLLYFLPDEQGRQSWAVYPALGAMLVAVLTYSADALTGLLLPLLLIVAGAFLLVRNGRGRDRRISRRE